MILLPFLMGLIDLKNSHYSSLNDFTGFANAAL